MSAEDIIRQMFGKKTGGNGGEEENNAVHSDESGAANIEGFSGAGIIRSLEFNGHSLEVIDHQSRRWLRLAELAEALEIDAARVRKLLERNPEEFEGYTATVDLSSVSSRHGTCSTPASRGGTREGNPNERVFTFQGFMAVLSLLNRSRLESESARQAVLEARRWGWDILHEVMMGSIERESGTMYQDASGRRLNAREMASLAHVLAHVRKSVPKGANAYPAVREACAVAGLHLPEILNPAEKSSGNQAPEGGIGGDPFVELLLHPDVRQQLDGRDLFATEVADILNAVGAKRPKVAPISPVGCGRKLNQLSGVLKQRGLTVTRQNAHGKQAKYRFEYGPGNVVNLESRR